MDEPSTTSCHTTSKDVTSSSSNTIDADSEEITDCSNRRHILGSNEKQSLRCLTNTLVLQITRFLTFPQETGMSFDLTIQ